MILSKPLALNISSYLYINNRNPHPLILGIHEDIWSWVVPVTCGVTAVGGIKQKNGIHEILFPDPVNEEQNQFKRFPYDCS